MPTKNGRGLDELLSKKRVLGDQFNTTANEIRGQSGNESKKVESRVESYTVRADDICSQDGPGVHVAAAMCTVPGSNSGATMTTRIRVQSAVVATALLLTTVMAPVLAEEQAQAQGQASADQQPPKKKHSKLKGAVVGGAGGAVVGGKKGAAAGAVGGALVQHHKNKKEAKQQEKAQKQ